MDSATLKATVRNGARATCGHTRVIWSNGLGFSWRAWEYRFGVENSPLWSAARRIGDNAYCGIGRTLRAAYLNAQLLFEDSRNAATQIADMVVNEINP